MKTRALTTSLLVTVVLGLWGEPAAAAPLTVKIKAGNTAETVGTATVERLDDGDGTETLHVTAQVPDGIRESHLCPSDAAFTDRIPPGQCQHSQGNTGTTVSYVVDLGDTYVGGPLHIQFHVSLGGASAYAGWLPGSPFFGDVDVPEPTPPTPVPVGTVGVYGLALLLGVLLLASRRVARRG